MSPSLPIDSLKDTFLTQLKSHHLVVEAETGSGKSTRLPIWAAQQGRVLVVEPRRVACTALAEYVAQLRGDQLGEGVGYAIRFDNRFNDQSQIVFVTPGVALRWLSDDQLAAFDTVMIDEFHERRWDTDLLLALLKQKQTHRLVVTSATMDSLRLAQYLGAERLQATGRNYTVEVSHLASDSRNMPDIRGIEKKVAEAILPLHQQHQDILVFLPGRKEIAQCAAHLKQVFSAAIINHQMDVIALHASVSDDERHRALTESDQQRIILATNVAETSLTIPGVTLIVDTGLERRTHQRNGRTVLGLHAISQASAEQRKGRAGRISAGQCIRLYGKAAPLERLTPPELQREELVESMLAAASCGARLDGLQFVDPVPEKSLMLARDKLLQMQAIDPNGLITSHGQLLYPLPIDTLFAHLITAMPDKASREAMVDLAAGLSVYQRVWQMPSGEENREKLAQWEPNHCDAMALVKLLRGTVPEWLTIDRDVLAEARQLSRQMREALQLPDLDAASSVKREPWLNAVMSAVPELVYVRREKRRQALGNGYAEVSIGRDSRFPEQAEAAVVFDQFALPGKGVKQNLVLATCMAPVTFAQLNQLDMGTEELGEAEVTEAGCRVAHRRVYAGRVIETRWQAPQGESAFAALVEMVLDGVLVDGLAEQVRADIHQWNLYLALGRYQAETCTRAPEPVEARDWLNTQLAALGVESAEDLALFGADDFPFDGIPTWEREAFDREFPYQVLLTDLTLNIEYRVGGKRVLAVYAGGNRKTDPKRWELPRWQGWKIQYRKASRTIDIK
ncbi:helicase-related protein [Photobacterium sp. TY1-4]|uniref:helicase-related protein n=1 Tax=Photobacterium sp. TY1-4 TaxID=2899122 RepID=UPI0021BE22FC|nr:helicase-related protein [Photobacterium sp. TY1-4]UXI02646.1 DEAD/DEAH box helicase [Photobacterium sp. TY1-4]